MLSTDNPSSICNFSLRNVTLNIQVKDLSLGKRTSSEYYLCVIKLSHLIFANFSEGEIFCCFLFQL